MDNIKTPQKLYRHKYFNKSRFNFNIYKNFNKSRFNFNIY